MLHVQPHVDVQFQPHDKENFEPKRRQNARLMNNRSAKTFGQDATPATKPKRTALANVTNTSINIDQSVTVKTPTTKTKQQSTITTKTKSQTPKIPPCYPRKNKPLPAFGVEEFDLPPNWKSRATLTLRPPPVADQRGIDAPAAYPVHVPLDEVPNGPDDNFSFFNSVDNDEEQFPQFDVPEFLEIDSFIDTM